MRIPRKSFSLVELMVAVSILSVGIVLVIRSFLESAKALNIAQNRIAAATILEKKMGELEEKAFIEDGLAASVVHEKIKINFSDAAYTSEIKPMHIEGLERDLNEVKLSLSWNEGISSQDAFLGTYVKNKK